MGDRQPSSLTDRPQGAKSSSLCLRPLQATYNHHKHCSFLLMDSNGNSWWQRVGKLGGEEEAWGELQKLTQTTGCQGWRNTSLPINNSMLHGMSLSSGPNK